MDANGRKKKAVAKRLLTEVRQRGETAGEEAERWRARRFRAGLDVLLREEDAENEGDVAVPFHCSGRLEVDHGDGGGRRNSGRNPLSHGKKQNRKKVG
jgi:hypothetical protein